MVQRGETGWFQGMIVAGQKIGRSIVSEWSKEMKQEGPNFLDSKGVKLDSLKR